MNKKLSLLRISMIAALIISVWGGTAFSATVGLRAQDPVTLEWVDEITIVPCTTFNAELYLDLEATETDLIANNGIIGYTVDVIWDPLVGLKDWVNGSSYNFVDVIDVDTGVSPVVPDWAGRELELSGYIFGPAVTTSHVMETFTLHCLAPGVTWLTPEGHFVDPVNFGLESLETLEQVLADNDQTLEYKPLRINQVPIPGALLLMGSGLLGLIGIRWRKQS